MGVNALASLAFATPGLTSSTNLTKVSVNCSAVGADSNSSYEFNLNYNSSDDIYSLEDDVLVDSYFILDATSDKPKKGFPTYKVAGELTVTISPIGPGSKHIIQFEDEFVISKKYSDGINISTSSESVVDPENENPKLRINTNDDPNEKEDDRVTLEGHTLTFSKNRAVEFEFANCRYSKGGQSASKPFPVFHQQLLSGDVDEDKLRETNQDL